MEAPERRAKFSGIEIAVFNCLDAPLDDLNMSVMAAKLGILVLRRQVGVFDATYWECSVGTLVCYALKPADRLSLHSHHRVSSLSSSQSQRRMMIEEDLRNSAVPLLSVMPRSPC